jgi:hypothetical protein
MDTKYCSCPVVHLLALKDAPDTTLLDRFCQISGQVAESVTSG